MKALTFPVLFICMISSCINNHCNEPMYAPLNIAFYSETDTSIQKVPIFFSIQGDETDSVAYATNANSINISLDAENEESRFIVKVASSASKMTVLSIDSLKNYTSIDKSQSYTLKEIINTNIYRFEEMDDPLLWLGTDENQYAYFYIPETDTLRVVHENSIEFISAECGCLSTFKLTQAGFTQNKIGVAMINNPLINSQNNEKHIKLFLENY